MKDGEKLLNDSKPAKLLLSLLINQTDFYCFFVLILIERTELENTLIKSNLFIILKNLYDEGIKTISNLKDRLSWGVSEDDFKKHFKNFIKKHLLNNKQIQNLKKLMNYDEMIKGNF